MMLELLALASLLLTDPSGDAHGAGNLVPPTSAPYASVAPFDLLDVAVLDERLLTVEITVAEIANPFGLANGLSLPVIDVYVDTGQGGRVALLPGPGLTLPAPDGWEIAFRVHGDDAFMVLHDEMGTRRPVEVEVQGNVVRLATTVERPERIRRLDAMSGVYDPFSPEGWRTVSLTPSPWGFSSDVTALPVIDVLAVDAAAQRTILERGVLPVRRSSGLGVRVWLFVALSGLVVASAGVLLRGLALRPRPATEASATPDRDWLIDVGDLEAASSGDDLFAAWRLDDDASTHSAAPEATEEERHVHVDLPRKPTVTPSASQEAPATPLTPVQTPWWTEGTPEGDVNAAATLRGAPSKAEKEPEMEMETASPGRSAAEAPSPGHAPATARDAGSSPAPDAASATPLPSQPMEQLDQKPRVLERDQDDAEDTVQARVKVEEKAEVKAELTPAGGAAVSPTELEGATPVAKGDTQNSEAPTAAHVSATAASSPSAAPPRYAAVGDPIVAELGAAATTRRRDAERSTSLPPRTRGAGPAGPGPGATVPTKDAEGVPIALAPHDTRLAEPGERRNASPTVATGSGGGRPPSDTKVVDVASSATVALSTTVAAPQVENAGSLPHAGDAPRLAVPETGTSPVERTPPRDEADLERRAADTASAAWAPPSHADSGGTNEPEAALHRSSAHAEMRSPESANAPADDNVMDAPDEARETEPHRVAGNAVAGGERITSLAAPGGDEAARWAEEPSGEPVSGQEVRGGDEPEEEPAVPAEPEVRSLTTPGKRRARRSSRRERSQH